MRLTIVGCAGSFPSAESAASSYLVEAEDAAGRTWRVVLDLGNGALGALQRSVDPAAVDAYAISHMHADHCADLCVLGVYLRYAPTGAAPAIPVYGPPGASARLTQMAGADPATGVSECLEVREWGEGAVVDVGPLRLEPVAMRHPVPAYGIRVTGPSELDPGRRVVLAYTGDTDECPGLDDLARGADLLLCEAAFLEGQDDSLRGVHLTGRRAGRTAAAHAVPHLVVTHMVAWNPAGTTVAEAREAYDGRLDVARAGAAFTL